MLTTMDIPEEILEIYRRNKMPITEAVGGMSEDYLSTAVDHNTDLCIAYPSSVIYIRGGIFKYFFNKKLIRYYSTGDIIYTPDKSQSGVSITNEYGAEVTVVKSDDFLKHLIENESLLKSWFLYQKASDYIMHALCSLHISEDFQSLSDMRQYEANTVIIKEGDEPENLFEMLEGSAVVTVNGAEIGNVNEDEVFGEISFLTGAKRGATVTTKTRCLVQVISRPDLEKFAKQRPGLIFKLSQTLAQRLTEVNRRLVSLSSLT